jgi:hypothetical protein
MDKFYDFPTAPPGSDRECLTFQHWSEKVEHGSENMDSLPSFIPTHHLPSHPWFDAEPDIVDSKISSMYQDIIQSISSAPTNDTTVRGSCGIAMTSCPSSRGLYKRSLLSAGPGWVKVL